MDQKTPSTEQIREIVKDHIGEQYTRNDSLPTSTVLNDLHAKLVEAAKAYESGPPMQRQAVCDAIVATSDFLRRQGFSDSTLVPLDRVVWSIVDLCNQNQPDPLFCSKVTKTKPKRSMKDAILLGHLAALVDTWLEAYPREGEEEDVAERLKRAAREMSGIYFGQLSCKNLESAQRLKRAAQEGDVITRAYDQMVIVIKTESNAAGGGRAGQKTAVRVQIKALNEAMKLKESSAGFSPL